MIKLIQNELIKIFKRKSIYVLLIISVFAIIAYNYTNPDQNSPSISLGTKDVPIDSIEKRLETMDKHTENYIKNKTTVDFYKLYNSYNEESWQRYALNEERSGHNIGNTSFDYHDIQQCLQTINEYELSENSEITAESYEFAKERYNKYVKLLNADDWKEFIKYEIKKLEEIKNQGSLTDEQKLIISLEIEICELRLNNNVKYGNDTSNQYLEKYREYNETLAYYQNIGEISEEDQQQYMQRSYKQYEANRALAKYAIENNITQDLFYYNKVDARNSFIRVFDNFNLIIVIIIIYISSNIITEETNKGTIKNLLIKPHKRSTILISKILACLITVIITMLFVAVAQYIVGGITFGFDSYELEYVGYDYNNHQLITMNLFSYIALVAIAKLPMYIMIIAFCAFMSVINNNMAMTMILTLIIFIICSTAIAEWSKVEAISIITRFLVTNNWDFSTYLFGQISNVDGVNFVFSVIVYIAYLLLLLNIAIRRFNKKEINNV